MILISSSSRLRRITNLWVRIHFKINSIIQKTKDKFKKKLKSTTNLNPRNIMFKILLKKKINQINQKVSNKKLSNKINRYHLIKLSGTTVIKLILSSIAAFRTLEWSIPNYFKIIKAWKPYKVRLKTCKTKKNQAPNQ